MNETIKWKSHQSQESKILNKKTVVEPVFYKSLWIFTVNQAHLTVKNSIMSIVRTWVSRPVADSRVSNSERAELKSRRSFERDRVGLPQKNK